MKKVDFIQSEADIELIDQLRLSNSALTILYKRNKSYCINFMKSMYNDQDEIYDIYQDAILVLYENVLKKDFVFSCSIQTYLNSICRNQILKRVKSSERFKIVNPDDNYEFTDNITDWHDDVIDVNIERVIVMKTILIEMKESSNKCYDILVRFFYKNQTMDQIATELQYTNADNAKNQKYRCQEKLKNEVFKRIQK